MSTKNPAHGLRQNARSPGSIVNAQHHDATGSEKDISGSPIAIKKVIADSTVVTPVDDFAIVRYMNRNSTPEYLWVGPINQVPATVNATNGIALTPLFHEVAYLPASKDSKISIALKSSSSQVHIVIME